MSDFSEFRKSIVFKLGVALFFSYIFYVLGSFMFPFFLALALSFLLAPIVESLEKLTVGRGFFHIPRGIAIFLSFVIFGLFLTLLVAVIAPPLFSQLNELAAHFPEYAQRAHVQDWQAIMKSGEYPVLPNNLTNLADAAIGWTMGVLGNMLRGLVSSSIHIVANLVGLIVVPFLSFYFLKDRQELCEKFVHLFREQSRPKVERILQRLGDALGGYVVGLGKLSFISGIVITLGCLCLDVPYALVFGFLAIVGETIPVFGPLFGAVAAIFTASASSATLAVHVGIFYAVYYLIDANVLMPKIMGETIDLPAVVLLVALMIGGKLFGILGMLFAVPVAGVYRVLYKELWHDSEPQAAQRLEIKE